ncbi:MAG: 4,5-DOPA dioxygenase extradiol [Dokdonella sp.]|uniref:4,5-DOPA-extradiol-dioxygenase n=1 Tax=Dokdonella sp. TaxID=2291710 RepID=UPI002BCE9ADA|nr:4,5-DOPA dioxygenase extradiol [Dokdonella sp.]HOX71345.1 4,5-DOPA dioxygenase extradiol [Dokdonella sp.]HPG95395.1 4,5-DOPA dioxygenase extradiol [Dokdonella sp.]HPN78601.1 4,5-DOPA dioxygenase extradiol [Dokdonella sp.]
MNSRMPTIFFGHGNPMNALQDNEWSRGWAAIGQRLPRPRAVLSVSAHWYLPGIAVTAATVPRTIHDFGGFPRELFEVQYPAPGDLDLVRRVRDLLSPQEVRADLSWGLDHGTWSVLRHVFPAADVPVVQLSIDESQPAAFHYALGRMLRPLRDEGILLIGSGDVVHNLHTYAWGRHPAEPFDWAVRFEQKARELMQEGKHRALVDYETLGRDAELSIPTPEHYLPLLYVLGASDGNDAVTFPVEGMDGGSISMLSVQFG